MKRSITVPSGRRVRWTFRLSAERREVPVSKGDVSPSPIVPSSSRAFRLAIAGGFVAVVVSIALVRYLAADQEYEVADPSFGSQAAASDRDSTSAPVANAPAARPVAAAPPAPVAPRVPAAVIPPVPAAPAPSVRPIAAKQPTPEPASTHSEKPTKTVTEPAPAPKAITPPVADNHEPEKAPTTAADARPIAITPPHVPPAPPAPAAAADEVTITGCLEVGKDDAGFRLSETEGENAPQARSWRSGFFKKRPTAVDLVAPAHTIALQKEIGQRVAATGVLNSRRLKVSSVRVVSRSCN